MNTITIISLLVAGIAASAACILLLLCGRLKSRIIKNEKKIEAARQAAVDAHQQAQDEMAHLYARLAHAFRLPISVIIGYAELIRDGITEEKDYIHKLHNKAVYLNELISHILMEFKNKNQMASAVRKTVNLIDVLNKAAADMTVVAIKRGVAVNVVSGEDEILVEGDENGLSKVFLNIIENSLKYMDGRGTVQITASKLQSEAILVFKDDGAGMDAAEAEHIFKLNYQGSNRVSGEGLGMYVVKTEVESHGGSVFVKSEPGCGMGVYITLPLMAAPAVIS